MKFQHIIFFILLLASCNETLTPKVSFKCDEKLFTEYSREPCGFRVCYPKNWNDSYPDRGFTLEKYEPGKTLQDDSLTSIHVFSNFTYGGKNSMGSFEEYIDSSRKQIYRDVEDLHFLKDVDTSWNGNRAHWFVYYMRFVYRKDTVKLTQLIIDESKMNLQYVLTFTQNKGTERKYMNEMSTFFSSFESSKKCN